jgi:hypothetical protein
VNYRKPITFTCRTPGCPNWIAFESDAYIPKDWECPACIHALEGQMLDDLHQREIARRLHAQVDAMEKF